ncbi:MAG: HAD family hydrolase [Anaerovoracaceae bacterium]|jgi:pyrophosphatase PpaX
MSKKNTVLFDFDGTIMDTNDLIYNSWQYAFNQLTGKDGDREAILETFGEPLIMSMENMFPDVPPERSVAVYREYQYAHFEEEIRLFPGMKDLLVRVKHRGYKTALVTSRLRPTTKRGMAKYGLAPFFDTMVTVEDCSRHKPDPQPVEIALDRLESEPQQSIMLGDSVHDLGSARNAGVEFVMVGWAQAFGAQAEATDLKPDHVIQKADELLDLI